MALPSASDAPTTSPSHGDTSSVHGESPRPIPEKRYVLAHPRLCTYPKGFKICRCYRIVQRFSRFSLLFAL